MLAVDVFGFGQDAAVPASTPVVTSTPPTRNVLLPAVPDGTTVRCSFDPVINGLRCKPVGLFEAPTVFLLGAAGLSLLAIGYVFGRTRFLPRYVERLAADPSKVLP